VENGYEGVEPSYYGGWDAIDKSEKYFDAITITKRQNSALAEIKRFGVNWSKTEAPSSNMRSQFEGTFADASHKEFLEGELVLNSGKKQFWCAEALKVENVFDMMARVHEAPAEFKRVFGE
jgi:hypothetical protein